MNGCTWCRNRWDIVVMPRERHGTGCPYAGKAGHFDPATSRTPLSALFPNGVFGMSLIANDNVPPGTLYMLPRDVLQATHDALKASEEAVAAVAVYYLGAMCSQHWWWLALLYANAKRKMLAAEGMVAQAELIIQTAASEKRIGCITNIGL
jgi:hypothetical protein